VRIERRLVRFPQECFLPFKSSLSLQQQHEQGKRVERSPYDTPAHQFFPDGTRLSIEDMQEIRKA
jgi:hypothetical protein